MIKKRRKRNSAGVPGVGTHLKQRVDDSYSSAQDGSVPLETVSVHEADERSVWPMIWAVTTVVLIIVTLYLFLG